LGLADPTRKEDAMPANLKPILYALGGALAAVLVTATTALAGSGVGGVFNLGEVNTVNAQTSLSGNAGGNPQLRVENGATVQNAFGVLGRITAGSPAGQTAGVRGINSGTNANGFGVWGFHQGSGVGVFGETGAGVGVLGKHTSTTGASPGVKGETASSADGAAGVFGTVTAVPAGTDSAAVRGTIVAPLGYGVFGENTGGSNGAGVFGRSNGRAGLLGEGERTGASLFSANTAVYACASAEGAPPCSGSPSTPGGVGGEFRAKSASGTATGISTCAGNTCSNGATEGVIGGLFSAAGIGATGISVLVGGGSAPTGISATASGSDAIGGKFVSDGADSFPDDSRAAPVGVIGESTHGVGGRFVGDSFGIVAQSSSGLAGKFEGDVHLTGKLTRAYTAGTANQAAPLAYGAITAGGSVITNATTPNVTSSFNSVEKRYEITIAGETYDINKYMTVATPISSTTPRFISTQSNIAGKLLVKIFNLSGTAVQSPFTFVTYKP
jgi:hypothetical protein